MPHGGHRKDPASVLQARDRERQVLQLYLRGLSWVEIAKQVGFESEHGARSAFDRAARRLPKKDLEQAVQMQRERLNDARRRIYTELAGRSDPANPGQTLRPDPDVVFRGVDRIVRIEEREAALLGLDAPRKSEVLAALVGRPVDDEEMDLRLARLTPQERDTLMTLIAKMEDRWVPPPGIEDQGETVETTATNVETAGVGGGENDGLGGDG